MKPVKSTRFLLSSTRKRIADELGIPLRRVPEALTVTVGSLGASILAFKYEGMPDPNVSERWDDDGLFAPFGLSLGDGFCVPLMLRVSPDGSRVMRMICPRRDNDVDVVDWSCEMLGRPTQVDCLAEAFSVARRVLDFELLSMLSEIAEQGLA